MSAAFGYAFEVLKYVADLGKFIYEAIADGQPERVKDVLPEMLLTTQKRALAEARADAKWGV